MLGIFKHLLGSVCLLLICLSACVSTGADNLAGNLEGEVSNPAPGSGRQFLPLDLRISGGFAGRNETLVVSVAGLATWTNARTQTTRSSRISRQNLERLWALLAEISGTANGEGGSRSPGRCRDCIEYDLSLSSPGKPLKIVVSSDRLSDSAYRNLIAFLISIGDEIKREETR